MLYQLSWEQIVGRSFFNVAVFFCKKENSALSEQTCLTNHTIGWDNSKLSPLIGVTTSAFVWRLGILTPPTLLISDHIKGPLIAAFRSPLMKALDRSVEKLGLWIVTSSVTFIKSANQSSIKLCVIVHLVAVWTLIYLRILPRHNTYNRYRYEKLTLILEALKVTR